MPAVYEQRAFRYRIDNLTCNTAAVWGPALNTHWRRGGSLPFRIRFSYQVTGSSGSASASTLDLRVSKNGGAYVAIGAGTGVISAPSVCASLDGDGMPNLQLPVGVGTGQVGVYDNTGATASFTVARGNYTEIEYALDFESTGIANGDTFDFRIYRGTTALNTYTQTPRTTIIRIAAAIGAPSYVLSGKAIALSVPRTLACAKGAYTWAIADLITSEVVGTNAAGSYALTGKDAGLTHNTTGIRVLAAGAGSYSLAIADRITNDYGLNASASSVTFDPSVANATLVLSNNNLTATNPSGPTNRCAIANTPITGKRYAEFTLSATTSNLFMAVGIGKTPAVAGLASVDGAVMAVDSTALLAIRNGSLLPGGSDTAGANPLLCMVAYDQPNDKVYFGANGVWYFGGNPAANTGGFTPNQGGDPLYFAVQNTRPASFTAAFTAASFTYTPPTGFSAMPSGAYTLGGKAAILAKVGSYVLPSASGTYAYNGTSPALQVGLPAARGVYALTGLPGTGLRVARLTTVINAFYVLTGRAIVLLAGRSIPCATGGYVLSGKAAGLISGRRIVCVTGSYALTGKTASLLTGRVLGAVRGAYSLTGKAANLLVGRWLAAASGSYVLSGKAAGLAATKAYSLLINSGAYALTGKAANLVAPTRVTVAPGSYALTGKSAGLTATRIFVSATGNYTLSGKTANPVAPYRLACASGSFVLTGKTAGLNYTPIVVFPIVAASGSYTLLIADLVTFDASQTLSVANGSYAVSGKATGLTYTPVAANAIAAERGTYNWKIADLVTIETVFPVASGSYSLTGKAAGLTYTSGVPLRILTAGRGIFALTGAFGFLDREPEVNTGSYSLNGRAVALVRGTPTLSADSGAYSLAIADRITFDYGLNAAKGAYALSAPTTALSYPKSSLFVQQGAYALGGKDVALRAPAVIASSVGSYAVAGRPVTFVGQRAIAAGTGAYTVVGKTTNLLRHGTAVAQAGGFILSGQAVTLARSRLITEATGTYALSGKAAALISARILVAAKGTYTFSGKDAGLVRQTPNALVISAQQGSYSLTGQATTLRAPYQMTSARGLYAFTGRPAGLNRGREIALNMGAYAVTGRSVVLTYDQKFFTIVAGSHAYTLGGKAVDFVAPVHEIAAVQMEADEHSGLFTAEEVTKGKPMFLENAGTDFQEAAE